MVNLHGYRLAEEELDGGSTTGSRTALHNYFEAARDKKKRGALCKNGLYTVQLLLVKWLHKSPSQAEQVQECYDRLGGMTVIGLSFDIIQDNAGQGFRAMEGRTGKTGTWLTTPSTVGPGIQEEEYFGDFRVISLSTE
jgi:hypothetical protein